MIRFWNAEVLTELEAVLDTIYATVRQREIFLELTRNFRLHPKRIAPG